MGRTCRKSAWLVLLAKPIVTAAVYAELMARGVLHSSLLHRQQLRLMCLDAGLALPLVVKAGDLAGWQARSP